jgi:hypothetical protein
VIDPNTERTGWVDTSGEKGRFKKVYGSWDEPPVPTNPDAYTDDTGGQPAASPSFTFKNPEEGGGKWYPTYVVESTSAKSTSAKRRKGAGLDPPGTLARLRHKRRAARPARTQAPYFRYLPQVLTILHFSLVVRRFWWLHPGSEKVSPRVFLW